MTRQIQIIGLAAFVLVAGLSALLMFKPTGREVPTASVTPAPRASAPATPRPVDAAPPRAAPRRSREPAPVAVPEPAAPAVVESAPDSATLHIASDVPGAQVFIDREYIGTTPVTAENVRPGTHRLNLSVEGYDGVADTIDVSPGRRDILIRFKEVRLDASLDVVHKHRIGSCKGRLVANAQGLRYDTDDKDDVFSAGLLDLELFQVDYLEKNLRIKLHKGRQYNFTDPEGNADRLFVFHRDVEKVRDRLKRGDPPAGD